ncbi:MAG: hypothetical protein VX438_19020 [Planctomycetota bacterium]|nr:hypothetical protein [Planctomycetota bacterium]
MKTKFSVGLFLLLLLQNLAVGDQDSPSQRYKQLVTEVETAMKNWETQLKTLREAEKKGGNPVPANAFTSPKIPFVAKFNQAAKDYAGTDDAIPFLMWLGKNALPMIGSERAAAKNAVRTLVTVHRNSKKLEELEWMIGRLDYFFGAEEALAVGKQLEKDSPSPKVRAYATFSRVGMSLNKAPVQSETFRTAKAEMLAVLKEVEIEDLSSSVKNRIKMRENFSLGMVPPDIQGIDLNGKPFSLSDYKGKILFIDFWGDW